MKIKSFALALLLGSICHAAVDDAEPEFTLDRQPAIEEFTQDEARLVPYIDDSGNLNGSIRETFQLPNNEPTPRQAENE